MEENAAVPPSATDAAALVPHLKKCGYADAQIERDFKIDKITIEVAAFAGNPKDNWSACLAAVNLDGNSMASAAKAQHLGAASVFVCGPQGIDWYGLGANGPFKPKAINWVDIGGEFRAHKAQLAPLSIYDAKLRRPNARPAQMWFFDAGLMPAVERNRGETLLGLVDREINSLSGQLGRRLDTPIAQEELYRTVFWQLAAKILHDKKVPRFINIDLKNVDQVFERMGEHHGEGDRFPPFGDKGRPAIEAMAASIAACGSLADISPEAIADVYENALLDKTASKGRAKDGKPPPSVRKQLGIHGTPFVLINHMLSQLWPMLDAETLAAPHVFEPACGHAPFLMRSMRWLRQWDESGETTTSHNFMRKHLRGMETEGFARQLAKLALTLADAPHGNSWTIQPGDMFAPGVLAKEAKKARILLSNPPYEAFTPAQRTKYAKLGEPVTANTKAVEMLKRTLPHLPSGGVFGVVMPVGVLHDKESKPVREELLREFDLSEISVFADNLFEHGDHEAAVLMGRKKKPRATPVVLRCRRVREAGMEAFKERLAFSREEVVEISEFARDPEVTFRLPDLREVWEYCSRFPRLGQTIEVSKGHEFFEKEVLAEKGLFSTSRRAGWLPVALNPSTPYSVVKLPIEGYLNYSPKTYRFRGGGAKPGHPQVVINESGPRTAWRFRAVEDSVGIAIQSRFLVVRARLNARHSLTSLWAVLNSPIANGFAYCWSGKRHTTPREWLALPLPDPSPSQKLEIEAAANAFRALAVKFYESQVMAAPKQGSSRATARQREGKDSGGPQLFGVDAPPFNHVAQPAEIRTSLLRLDAAVLRLYDLPPRLERQLLDLFTGVERRGVGLDGSDGHSTFRGYYPPGFTSALPLHMVISERFERARADTTAERFKPGESAHVRDMLRTASVGTGEG